MRGALFSLFLFALGGRHIGASGGYGSQGQQHQRSFSMPEMNARGISELGRVSGAMVDTIHELDKEADNTYKVVESTQEVVKKEQKRVTTLKWWVKCGFLVLFFVVVSYIVWNQAVDKPKAAKHIKEETQRNIQDSIAEFFTYQNEKEKGKLGFGFWWYFLSFVFLVFCSWAFINRKRLKGTWKKLLKKLSS